MHFLIGELKEMEHLKNKAPNVLAKNGERFRTLTLGRFIIQDSLEHLPASLDALTKDLGKLESFHYPIVQQLARYKNLPLRKEKKGLSLLIRKGVFCYEHFRDFDQMKAATSLPDKSAFYSKLNEEGISQSDYEFAQETFKYFKCTDMVDYMMLYCSLDVALLCEAFLQYRKMVIKHFELDPTHYLGIPGLSFDIMLKMYSESEISNGRPEKEVGLDLLSDPEMERFFSNGIRGGQSFVAQRYARGESNPNRRGYHLLYVDGKLTVGEV